MRGISVAGALFGAVCAAAAFADVVNFPASKDNTLYESSTGETSNGMGSGFFAGRTLQYQLRRGLIEFDIAAAVPTGSTVTEVSLTLMMTQTISADVMIGLHRSLKEWGEGTSIAGGMGGMGGLATDGDATWVHTFRPTEFWGTPGGSATGPSPDFVIAASSQRIVGPEFIAYAWPSTPELVADVQGWLDSPGENHGWFVMTNEETAGETKRFGTREHEDPAQRPVLRVTFSPPALPCYANCDGSTTPPILNVLDFICFQSLYAQNDPYANCDNSSNPPILNILDFVCFQTKYATGCR